MSMTVEQIILLSRLFLGAMIILTIVAAVLFFVFDVRRAWRILRGKKLPPVHKNKAMAEHVTQKISTNDLLHEELRTRRLQMQTEDITKLLQKQGNIDDQYKGQDVTTVLGDTQDTVLLVSQDEQDNKNDIMLDITFIHTELVL